MKDSLKKELYEKYPEVLSYIDPFTSKRLFIPIDVGDGWYPLIDYLCRLIKQTTDEYNSRNPIDKIGYMNATQIKEKFGGLRFYTSSGHKDIYDEIEGAIGAMEALSYNICEDCGNKGKATKTSWVRTLCKQCLREHLLLGEEKCTLTKLRIAEIEEIVNNHES